MEERSPYQKSCPEAGGAFLVLGERGGGCRARCAAAAELEAKLQRAVEFKAEGHRCYKQKKLREAIGKYHRALLQLKGLEPPAGDEKAEAAAAKSSSLVAWHRLSAEQWEQADSTEIERYDSLTGKSPPPPPRWEEGGSRVVPAPAGSRRTRPRPPSWREPFGVGRGSQHGGSSLCCLPTPRERLLGANWNYAKLGKVPPYLMLSFGH
ncbi:tetratricopeptide repeat protein 9B [Crotalus adamanteus]|uniref:Tetratricopeptide repeat protein 9B n=1 Tax=Crotalus adamanteus TaxID=8729 RepID=A0AAW1AW71_CROAD